MARLLLAIGSVLNFPNPNRRITNLFQIGGELVPVVEVRGKGEHHVAGEGREVVDQ